LGFVQPGCLVIAIEDINCIAPKAGESSRTTKFFHRIIVGLPGGGNHHLSNTLRTTSPEDDMPQHGLSSDIDQHFAG
jgi:hypothetical protein